MRNLLGGKGANLAEMTNIGLPCAGVDTITTETCNEFTKLANCPMGFGKTSRCSAVVEKEMGKKLGDAKNPLLVSIRSGAKFSMPGMMDTVLNLVDENSIKGIIAATGNTRFAYDAYRRFLMTFSDIVLSSDYPKLKKENFEKIFSAMKSKLGVKLDTDVDAEHLKELTKQYKAYFKEITGEDFPTDPLEQMKLAVVVVQELEQRAGDYLPQPRENCA